MTTIDYLTAILVFITAIYAYLTHKMAKASEASVQIMRSQLEAMSRPYIAITPYVRPHTSILYLKIENTGKSSAENLLLSMDKDFFQFGESKMPENNLRTKPAFLKEIHSLPPNGNLSFALAQGFVIFAPEADPDKVPQQFSITAKYKFGQQELAETHKIDLQPYIGSEGERNPVVDELEKLRKLAEKWK